MKRSPWQRPKAHSLTISMRIKVQVVELTAKQFHRMLAGMTARQAMQAARNPNGRTMRKVRVWL